MNARTISGNFPQVISMALQTQAEACFQPPLAFVIAIVSRDNEHYPDELSRPYSSPGHRWEEPAQDWSEALILAGKGIAEDGPETLYPERNLLSSFTRTEGLIERTFIKG